MTNTQTDGQGRMRCRECGASDASGMCPMSDNGEGPHRMAPVPRTLPLRMTPSGHSAQTPEPRGYDDGSEWDGSDVGM